MDRMRFTKEELRNQASGVGTAEAMPDAETQGSVLSVSRECNYIRL